MGGQLLRHAFDDCHRVEKETAKRAEEKKRREEERRQTASGPDSDSDSDDEDNCEVHVPLRAYATRHVELIGRMPCIRVVQAMRINDVYIHIASKSGREVEFYKRHGFEMTRIDREYAPRRATFTHFTVHVTWADPRNYHSPRPSHVCSYYRRVEPPDALVFSKNYAHVRRRCACRVPCVVSRSVACVVRLLTRDAWLQYQVEQQLLKDNPTSGADAVGSLKDMLGKWVSQNWTAMESQLAVLPADLRAWLLNYLTVNSLLVDPLLHILAPDSAATRLGTHTQHDTTTRT